MPYSHHPYAYALSNPVLWTDPSGRCPWWLTDVCDTTGVDPDTWQNVPGVVKGAYGLDRDASDLDFAGALVAKPYETFIAPIQTIASATDLATDGRARGAFVRDLSKITPATLGQGIIRPWQEAYQGVTCGDGYLIGRGAVGIANELLVVYGLYRGGQALKGIRQAASLRAAGSEAESILPKAADLKLSRTVEQHTLDVSRRGTPARPYMNPSIRTRLIQDIMDAREPIPDPQGVPGALRWDVEGSINGSRGVWELVIDTKTNTVLHFLFKSVKKGVK
jgi:hypothetical protein